MPLVALDVSNEPIAVLGHSLDEPGARHIITETLAKRLDALGQRLVGDWYAAPDLVEEALLGNEPAAFRNEQQERIEIARIELHSLAAAAQAPVAWIEEKSLEAETSRRHVFSKTS
jgi:hypothetical protein